MHLSSMARDLISLCVTYLIFAKVSVCYLTKPPVTTII